MIGGFDAHDLRFEAPIVLVQVAEKLELGGRRPDDEERVGTLERARHLLEEAAGVLGRAPHISRSERVPVEMVLRREDRRLVGRIGMEMKDPGFLPIDPGDRVGGHAFNGLTNEARCLCN